MEEEEEKEAEEMWKEKADNMNEEDFFDITSKCVLIHKYKYDKKTSTRKIKIKFVI